MDEILYLLFGILAPIIAVGVFVAIIMIIFSLRAAGEGFTPCEKLVTFLVLLPISAFCFYLTFSFYNKDISDLGYVTSYGEERQTVEVKEVLKEKGKEAQYVISVSNVNEDGITIPESVYNKYIGDENNTITVKRASVDVYVGHSYPLGIRTSFSGESKRLRYIWEERFSYPWEEDAAPYTEEEAKKLAEAYLDGNRKTNGSTNRDVRGEITVFE